MNTSPIVTVFYSNYSGNCKALLQSIKSSNIMDNLSIKFINIDNNVMKDVISKKFSVVPTIVVLLADEISLYTGNNAFEWFNMFSSSLIEDKSSNNNNNTTTDIIPAVSESSPSSSRQTQDTSSKSITELAAEISKAREKF
jgi:hypothetical protein